MKRRVIASVLGALALLLAIRRRNGRRCIPRGADGQPERRQRATSDLRLGSDANRSEQHEHLRSGAQPRQRRSGHADQLGVVGRELDELELDHSGCEPESVGRRHPDGDQSALNGQVAGALSTATQDGASNQNIPVRVLSPGSTVPSPSRTTASSTADSTNTNTTTRRAIRRSPVAARAAARRRRARTRPVHRRRSGGAERFWRRLSRPPTSRQGTRSSREPPPPPRRSIRRTRTSMSAFSAPATTAP